MTAFVLCLMYGRLLKGSVSRSDWLGRCVCASRCDCLRGLTCFGEPQRGSPRIAGGFNPREYANRIIFPGGEVQCAADDPRALGYRAAVEVLLRNNPGFPAVTRGYSWENRSAVLVLGNTCFVSSP